jgi:hypothetical protein
MIPSVKQHALARPTGRDFPTGSFRSQPWLAGPGGRPGAGHVERNSRQNHDSAARRTIVYRGSVIPAARVDLNRRDAAIRTTTTHL